MKDLRLKIYDLRVYQSAEGVIEEEKTAVKLNFLLKGEK